MLRRSLSIALLVLGVGAAEASAAPYKILSYNVQGLPQLVTGIEYDYGRSNEARGKDIGIRVRSAGYDVAAFNEVFADSMREGLLSELPASVFPTRIPQLDGGTAGAQDSGLMLVSRFKTIPMPNVQPSECASSSPAGCSVAFHEFQACSNGGKAFADCNAEKGIGLVRLANTATGRPLDVLFTHMQADYGGANAATRAARAKQFDEVRAFMDRWLPRGQAGGRDAVFMGDLNVIHGNDEWAQQLGTNSALDNDFGFRDLWSYEHSASDRGHTYEPRNIRSNSNSREKLDYVLLRRATAAPACVHHQRMPWKLMRDSTRADLSDHWPVEVTIGSTLEGNCSPHRAEPVTASRTVSAMPAEPGGSLWYRFDTVGTWNIHVSTPGAVVQAFRSVDLSNAIASKTGAGHLFFSVTHGRPVYVRAAALARNDRPTMAMAFHRGTGAAMNDPIHLPTGVTVRTGFWFDFQNPSSPANADEQYFYIRARGSSSGVRQTIRVAAKGAQGDTLRMRVRLLSMAGKELVSTGGFSTAPVLKTKLKKAGGAYLVAVRRDGGQIGHVDVRYDTNLRSIRLLRVRCNVQEDNTGDDHIKLLTTLDRSLSSNPSVLNLGSFDGDQARSLETKIGSKGMVNVVKGVSIGLREIDNDPDDDLGSGTIKAGPLAFEDGKVGRLRFTGDGADYDVYYERVPMP